MKQFVGFLAVVFLLTPATPATGATFTQGMPPAIVEVQTLEKRPIAAVDLTAASVISLNDAYIATEVEGRLLWIVEVGTRVKKGAVIARLDQSLLTINLQRAEAAVSRLQADLAFREEEVIRQQKLSSSDFASKSRLQSTIAQRDMARADLLSAKASLMQAKRDMALSSVKAPFDGVVVEKRVSVGSFLSRGSALSRLVDSSSLEISLSVPQRNLPFLSDQKYLLVSDATGQTLPVPIRSIVPVSDQSSRQLQVRLAPMLASRGADDDATPDSSSNSWPHSRPHSWPKNWIVGAALTVSVPASKSVDHITIPREALVIKGTSMMVYKLAPGGTAAIPLRVQLDFASGPWVTLKNNPFKAGDKVIIRGAERLIPGQPLQVKE